MGTAVANGTGAAQVTATGMHVALGLVPVTAVELAKLLRRGVHPSSPITPSTPSTPNLARTS